MQMKFHLFNLIYVTVKGVCVKAGGIGGKGGTGDMWQYGDSQQN